MRTCAPFPSLRAVDPREVEAGPVAGALSPGDLPACGRRVCAWCEPQRDLGPAPDVPAGRVTHGICPACLAVEKARIGLVEVRQHPHGGFTHAVPETGGVRIYRGNWPTRRAAAAAL